MPGGDHDDSESDDDDQSGDDHDGAGDDDHPPDIDTDDQVAAATAPPAVGQRSDRPAPAARSEATVLRTVQTLGAVIGPSALVTALLYYFGWAKAQAFSQYFGLDVSLFSLSTQDYVLQSIRAVFVPFGVVLVAGLLLLRAHDVVVRRLEREPQRPLWPRAAAALAVAGAVLFLCGLVLYRLPAPSDIELVLTPLTFMAAVGLVGYAALVERRRREALRPATAAPTPAPASAGAPALTVLLVSLLIAVGLVWEVAYYADIKGREEARFVHDQLAFQPTVLVYSAKRLEIGAAGVKEVALAADSAFPFRYDGLKLLFHEKGTYFLVPEGWSLKTDSATVVLREDATVRFELVRPADPPAAKQAAGR